MRHSWLRQLGQAALAVLFLAGAIWAATVPPPMAHPRLTVAPAAQRVHNEFVRLTEVAAKKGQYDCCINPACEFCGLHFAMCPCARNLVAGKAVCRECKGGWDVGEGRVAGIKASQVKGMSAAQALQMLKSMHHTARTR